MLFINDGNGQILVADMLLKNRVGADQYIDRSIHQPHECRFPHPALVAPGQDREIDRDTCQQFLQAFKMLPRQNFGRSQKSTLISRFHRR